MHCLASGASFGLARRASGGASAYDLEMIHCCLCRASCPHDSSHDLMHWLQAGAADRRHLPSWRDWWRSGG